MKKVIKDVFLKLILHELHNDLPFLPKKMKIEKFKKHEANLHDKFTCYTHKKFETSIKP